MTVVGRVVAAGMIAVVSIALGSTAQAAAATGQADYSGQAVSSLRAASSTQRAGSSGQITSPSDGQVVSSSSVEVSARTGLMQLKVGLYVEGPSTPSQKVAGGGANQTISGTFDAGDAPNGSFTVILKGEITGTRYASSTFALRRPAEAPGNVNAGRQGADKVLVTWSKGSEPDLQSYEVSNTQSGVVGRLPADSACAGSSCKAVLAVPSRAVGERVGFTVKAFRGDGDGGSIESGDSAPAYIAFPSAPSAQPTKKKTTTQREQTFRNDDARNVDALPTLPAKKQAVPSSRPTPRKPASTKLPDIPDADPSGNLPIPTGDERGENGGLVPADVKDDSDSAPVQSDGVKAQSNETPIGNIGQYGLYVAGGILLLLLGAHAGAWARRRALATVSDGSAPMPPAVSSAGEVSTPATAPQAANLNHGAQTQPANGTAARGTSAARRPAVILAVARTRAPEQASRAHEQSAQGSEPPSSRVREQLSRTGQSRPEAEWPHGSRSRWEEQEAGHSAHGGVARAYTVAQRDKAPSSDQVRGGEFGALPADIDADALRRVQEGQPAEKPQQGPVHIALASSAVTNVPVPSAGPEPSAGPGPSGLTVAPAVHLEERWDDYLPPSPRSMEDSGFWERPQPGASDFWAADDDGVNGNGTGNGDENGERSHASHRHKGGER